MPSCKICGEWNCQEHVISIGRIVSSKQFIGSSPPEMFVGRWNYPNVYTGILAPQETGDTEILSSHEQWHKRRLSIPEITSLRNQLIYGRTQQHIKKAREKNKFTKVVQEIAMTHKSIATEFRLQKPIQLNKENHPTTLLIARTAPVEHMQLQENAPVKPKIDYLVNDTDVKSTQAMQELYKSGIAASSIMKLLSAGLLGRKTARKLVPTRWSITAVDDTLSKQKLEKIKTFQELSEIRLFTAEYLGNHYEFLLLPGAYSFEVIEISTSNGAVWHDYESNFPRKNYADSVTGAYYANRLALAEYLEKTQRQAQCIVMREVRPEYTASCGVGILREISREAFNNSYESFNTIKEAFQKIQSRLHLPITQFTEKSWLLQNYGKQKKLSEFLNNGH
ncbi:MAG: hypothetical protein AABX12_05320 [Nanoarchaeota archaeon]